MWNHAFLHAADSLAISANIRSMEVGDFPFWAYCFKLFLVHLMNLFCYQNVVESGLYGPKLRTVIDVRVSVSKLDFFGYRFVGW